MSRNIACLELIAKKNYWSIGLKSTALFLGLGSAVIAYERLQPVPTLYYETNITHKVESIHQFPKAELKFGNIGFGPMHLFKLEFQTEVDGRRKILNANEFEQFLSFSQAELSYISSGLLKSFVPPIGWASGAFVPVATFRPKGDVIADAAWLNKLSNEIQSRKLSLRATYGWCGIELFARTKNLPIF